MVGGELQEALQQVTAGGDAGVQDHLPAHRRQPAKNLLQVVPAGVAGHLRIVPAGAEQPTAEKGIVDIDGIHRQGRGAAVRSSRRTSARSRSSSSRTVTTIRVWRSATGRAGRSRRLISRVCGGLIGGGLSRSRGSGSLSRAYSRSAATGCQRSACGGRGLASSRGCCSRYWRGVTPCWRLNKSLIIRVLANPCSRAICWTVLRVVNSWSAAWRRRSAVRYWTKLTPTSLRNKRDSQASETNSAAATSCNEEATLIVSVDPRHHAGYSPAPFFGIAPGRGGDGLAKARGQQQRYLTPASGWPPVGNGQDD